MYMVCAYYTKDSIYEKYANQLRTSLEQLNIPYDIEAVNNLGDWYANIQYKPVFLKQMLEKHYPNSIVYVDVDAVFLKYPDFFDKLDANPKVNIAVHLLDHSKYKRKDHPLEMLSGTIFLKNSREASIIICEWENVCNQDSRLWDQVALSRVLRKYKYYVLPEEYCTIFDYMSSVKDPVIKHFQASREFRRSVRTNTSKVREVKGGTVQIKRKRIY